MDTDNEENGFFICSFCSTRLHKLTPIVSTYPSSSICLNEECSNLAFFLSPKTEVTSNNSSTEGLSPVSKEVNSREETPSEVVDAEDMQQPIQEPPLSEQNPIENMDAEETKQPTVEPSSSEELVVKTDYFTLDAGDIKPVIQKPASSEETPSEVVDPEHMQQPIQEPLLSGTTNLIPASPIFTSDETYPYMCVRSATFTALAVIAINSNTMRLAHNLCSSNQSQLYTSLIKHFDKANGHGDVELADRRDILANGLGEALKIFDSPISKGDVIENKYNFQILTCLFFNLVAVVPFLNL